MTRDDWRSVGLLLALEARRHVNRLRSFGHGHQADGRRTATAGKRRGTWWVALIGIFAVFQVLFVANGAAQQGQMLALDRILIESRTHSRLVRDAKPKAEAVRDILAKDAAVAHLEPDVRAARLDSWMRAWEQEGITAFAHGAPPFFIQCEPPRDDAERAAVARMYSLMLLATLLALVCHGLGLGNRDLARSDDPRRLLAQQPISDRAAVAGRVLAAAVTEPVGWLALPLCTGALAFYAGWDGWSCLAVLALIPGLALAAAGTRTVLEELLRARLTLTARRWAQGILTTLSLVLLMALLAPAVWRPLGEAWVVLARSLPLDLVPTTALFTEATTSSLMRTALLVLAAGLACGWTAILVAGPIAAQAGSTSGMRRRSGGSSTALSGVARDALLLRRDPLILVQTLIVPAVLVLFQVVFNRHAATAALNDPRHIAAVAIFVGCYPLGMVTLRAFSAEVRHLWIPWMTPASPTRMLVGKAAVGGGIACSYALATLAIMHGIAGSAPGWQAPFAIVACLGLAALAVPLGALGTRLERGEPMQQLRQSAGWTLFFTQGMCIAALYVGVWQALACLMILAAFAAALWQRLDHDLPWILDPTDHPPARLDAARACSAILAYFMVQTVALAISLGVGLSPATALVVGSATAAIISVGWSLAALGRSSVAGVRRACAILPHDGTAITLRRCLGHGCVGVATGLAASLAALAWSWYLAAHNLGPDASPLADLPVWALTILAVAIAPLVEEFLFRGLLFHAVRAWRGPLAALLASTALFTVIHPVWGWPVVGLMGFACAVLVHRTGWLLAPILAHATYNLVVTLAAG